MSVAIFLTISCAFAQSLSIDPNTAGRLQLSSLLQHSVGKILSEFGHAAIAKRQTVYDITTQDVVDCVSSTIEYQCGSVSGYSQKVVDIATGCRNDSYARNTANTCIRNDKGETCGAVTLKFLSGQTNAESCLGSITKDFCSSACRDFLQSAKDSVGCCLNAYVNKTDYPLFEHYREHVDHRLWDLCGVDLPEEECKDSGIKVQFSKEVKSCTSQEILTNFVQYECSADVGQALVDNIMENDRCYIFSAVMVDACSSNGMGQYCAETIGTDLMNTFGTDPYVIALNSDCGARDPDSGCTTACKESINAIKQAYGCCVNVYNDSSIGLQLGSLSYSVWNDCGIETPGFCQTTQILPTKPPPPPTTDSISETTTESAPVTQRGAPVSSSERPDIGVIVVTEFIPDTTKPEPDVVTENIVSTDEDIDIIEETEPTEPTESESNPPEEVEPTEPEVEENEPTTEEGDSTPLEEIEPTEPEPEDIEPTTDEGDIMETETESTPLEEEEPTEPGDEEIEPTTDGDTMETEPSEPTESIPLEEVEPTEPEDEEIEPTTDEGDNMEMETENTPLEEVEPTEPEDEEIEPTIATDDEEDMETIAPTQESRPEDEVDESADTTAAPEIIQSTEPTSNDEDGETIQSTEEQSHATDHEQVQTESSPSTEATDSTHPTDHSQTASLPTVSSEPEDGQNVEIVPGDNSNGDHFGAHTESGDPPSAGPPRADPQAFNGSVPSARALLSTVIAVGVAVTLFIQQL